MLSVRFADIAARTLTIKSAIYAPATRALANIHLSRLIENFGHLPVDAINDLSWAAYLRRERQKRQRKFFDDRKFMRIVLHQAREEGLLARVPRLPIPDPPTSKGRELSMEEIKRLESKAGPLLRFQIRIAWKMGLRRGEMLRLRRDQINTTDRFIQLDVLDTKTRRARMVPIPADLCPEFCARLACIESEYIFPGRDGLAPLRDNKKAWQRCKRDAGVVCRWHDLRHTCASMLLRRGIPIHVVKSYLGMSQRVLLRIYAHVDLEDLKRAADRMEG